MGNLCSPSASWGLSVLGLKVLEGLEGLLCCETE